MTTTVRPAVADEAEAIAELINAHASALHGEPDLTARTVSDWFANEDVEIRLAEVDGRLACYGDLVLSPSKGRADLDVREHPSHRGSARAMLDELESLAAAKGAATMRAHVLDEDSSFAAVLAERGYRPIRHSYRMIIPLDGALQPPQWPDGMAVRAMREGEEHAVHAANNEAFADHWGFEPDPYDRWARLLFDTERFDRSLCFLAVEGDEIAGIALCSMHSSGDPTFGWVSILGVRPGWRRRGIGLALLLHSFEEFERRGCDRVGLGVDAESTTGAIELYARAGMRVERRTDSLEKLA